MTKMTKMTPEEYKTWKATRGDNASKWDMRDCIKADALIKQVTLDNYAKWVGGLKLGPDATEYLNSTMRLHFGSVEADAALMELNLYPEWM
jgi:hypothetical protein